MAHPPKALVLAAFLLLFQPLLLPAQSTASGPARDLANGIELFRNSQYEKAAALFQKVVSDPAAAAQRAEATLLLAKSFMAVGKLAEAGRSLDAYLASFAGAPDYPEAVYQKARLLFMQEDFEAALKALQSFISGYPASPLVPSAWFWAGESLYSLGRLDDAQAMYAKIVSDYPTSVKIEAASYKLELIQVRRREAELSRLLTWSHEDFLKTLEDYRSKELAYTQAIESYQKRIASTGTTAAQDQKTIADLRQQLDSLNAKLAADVKAITDLQAQLSKKTDEAAGLSSQLAAARAASAREADRLALLQKTLETKAAALALKEQLLQLAAAEAGGGR